MVWKLGKPSCMDFYCRSSLRDEGEAPDQFFHIAGWTTRHPAIGICADGDADMFREEKPNYVERCVSVVSPSFNRWAVDIGLIATLLGGLWLVSAVNEVSANNRIVVERVAICGEYGPHLKP